MAVEADPIALPAIEPDDYKNFDDSEHAKAFYAMLDEAKALPADEVVGQIIKFQVADGYAHYRVGGNVDGTVTVQHIDFLDGWRADPILIKGLDADDVRELVRRDRAMSALFGGGS